MQSSHVFMKTLFPTLALIIILHCGNSWSSAGAYYTSGCLGGTTNLASKAATSVMCLSCHDGSVAKLLSPMGFQLRNRYGQWHHPVMISYEKTYLQKPKGFVSRLSLDKRLHLSQNQVQCVTCHTYSEDKHWQPAIPNDHSALCLSCHRK